MLQVGQQRFRANATDGQGGAFCCFWASPGQDVCGACTASEGDGSWCGSSKENCQACGSGTSWCGSGSSTQPAITPAPVPSPTTTPAALLVEQCPWLQTTQVENQLQCLDGTLCTGWSCCSARGGRSRCPPNKPVMCTAEACGEGEHCCKADCTAFGGARPCPLEPPAPTPFSGEACPWLRTTAEADLLACMDGTTCTGWSCCAMHGGRARCPPNKPLMCNGRTCGGGDHCCKEACEAYEGRRPCSGATLPSMLMLGNSYTFYNGGVDGTLRSFFSAAHGAWFVKALTKGGASWQYHLEQAALQGSPHHGALTSGAGGEQWGFVVLQEQSHLPALCCHTSPLYADAQFAASAEAVVELDRLAEVEGARTVLYQTWGRRDGHATRSYLSSFSTMNEAVRRGYQHYASLITRPDRRPVLAPVGRAFGLVYDEVLRAGGDPGASASLFHRLYDPDGTHPSSLGTYLAACVLHASITGETPLGLPSALGLSEAEASSLRSTAAKAVR